MESVMPVSRRKLLQLTTGASLAAASLSQRAFALNYPTRPVRIVVPYGPGSVPDIAARLLGQRLSERFAQPFIIENRPGAGGSIGTEAVVHSAADGYTLVYFAGGQMIIPSLYDKLTFSFVRDIAPVASVLRAPHLIAVHPSMPVNSIPDLIAYARNNPGKLNEGSSTGATPHLVAELFKMSTGTDIVHVAYRAGGAAALPDLLGGQLQISFDTIGVLAESVKAGKLRALAVTTKERWGALPDIPTMGEFVPGFEMNGGVGGIGAPAGTSSEIIETLNHEINAALADGKMTARLADMGAVIVVGSSEDCKRLIASETEKWAQIIRTANVKPE
jgi:tripartite-type tricarboxylate transporter receptor subunit TctC